jgi:hypothetical protein
MFVALLKRCAPPRTRDAPPFVTVRQGSDGLSIVSFRGKVGLKWHQRGRYPSAALTLTADHLAKLTGNADVVLARTSPTHGEARWSETGEERTIAFPVVDPDERPPFPKPAGEVVTLLPGFLAAMAEAARTTAREAVRFAFTRILFCGKTGQVVATDGKHLLIQDGFRFPWADGALVPSIPAFGAKDLVAPAVTVGRSKEQVLVSAGPWTLALKIDPAGRFPSYADSLPRGRPVARCVFEPDDAVRLADAIPKLPTDESGDDPVTLVVGDGVTVKSVNDAGPGEVRARGATAIGKGSVTCDRRYLVRALKLGLTAVEIFDPGKPIVARDDTRTYIWMPLARPEPTPRATETESRPEPLPEAAMPPSTNGHPSPGPPNDPTAPPDLLAEAEAVRDLLQAAATRLGGLIAALRRQRKQSRALKQAVLSLRQLQPFDQ